jgi:hypothetical protein
VTIPLDRLRDFPQRVPEHGHVSVAFARHQAATWPSPEVLEYARHRSALIHDLVDGTGVSVVSWGETDGDHPREVVEIVVVVIPAVISAVSVILAALISRPPKGRSGDASAPTPPPGLETALPGIAVRREDGAVLRLTYRDRIPRREAEKQIRQFLEGA